jgi:hypothetical protein
VAKSHNAPNISLRRLFTRFRKDPFGSKVLHILQEVIIVILLLGGIAVVHKVLNWWLGHNYQLFDRIPIRYIIDLAHGLAMVRFLLDIISEIVEIIRGFNKPFAR